MTNLSRLFALLTRSAGSTAPQPPATTFSCLFPNPAVARWAPSDPRPLPYWTPPGWSQPWRARCSSSIPSTGPLTGCMDRVH